MDILVLYILGAHERSNRILVKTDLSSLKKLKYWGGMMYNCVKYKFSPHITAFPHLLSLNRDVGAVRGEVVLSLLGPATARKEHN